MWETLRNAWKIPELRKKILYTLFMLLLYRLLCFVPTPGVDAATVANRVQGISLRTGFVEQRCRFCGGFALDLFLNVSDCHGWKPPC